MAKLLTWRDEWTLRIDTLDDDHRKMVELLLEIAHRFGDGYEHQEGIGESENPPNQGKEGIYSTLDHFGVFARQHFQREEEFLRTIDYPGLPDHHSEHVLLMAELKEIVRELRERGSDRLTPQDLETLKQWVVAHILGMDRKFADHYFQICG